MIDDFCKIFELMLQKYICSGIEERHVFCDFSTENQ